MRSRPPFLPALALLPLLLAGCATSGADPADPAATSATPSDAAGVGHGAIAGAVELAEPALHLTTLAPEGTVHHLDLLSETTAVLGRIAPAEAVVSEGRFLVAARHGSVSVVDSGVWTWNHVDHFHYYEGDARVLGELDGDGRAHPVASDLGVGVSFEGGEAVLLDLDALKDGEIAERFRLSVAPGPGMVVPLPVGALVADGDALRRVDADGVAVESVPCLDAQGTIATVVGVVVGCADGAVLVSGSGADTVVERIAYPAGAGARAVSFAGREHRPTVAGFDGGSAFWLLDTRERSWTRVETGEPLAAVAAVDDADGHVVALTAAGAVAVFAGGAEVSRTEPLVAASLGDPASAGGVTLTVDPHRVYLNGPAEQTLFEIAPADGARVARTFEADHTPAHLAETGR